MMRRFAIVPTLIDGVALSVSGTPYWVPVDSVFGATHSSAERDRLPR